MNRHIGRQHAIYTAGEQFWEGFYGDVPRVGEIVYSTRGHPYRVISVKWYLDKWYEDPDAKNRRDVTLSQARVLVEPEPQPTSEAETP